MGKAGAILFHTHPYLTLCDGAVSSWRLASALTPGQPPGVNRGKRGWAQTSCGTPALSQEDTVSARRVASKWGWRWDLTEGGPISPWITALKRQKPETKVPLGHMEFPNLYFKIPIKCEKWSWKVYLKPSPRQEYTLQVQKLLTECNLPMWLQEPLFWQIFLVRCVACIFQGFYKLQDALLQRIQYF